MATSFAGQIRLPKPYGRSKSMRRGSSVLRKRSGLKASGSGKISGSFENAIRFNEFADLGERGWFVECRCLLTCKAIQPDVVPLDFAFGPEEFKAQGATLKASDSPPRRPKSHA